MNTLPVCIKLKYDSLWEQTCFKSIHVSACTKLSDNLKSYIFVCLLNDHIQHYAKLNNFFLKGEFTMQTLVKE